MRAGQLRHRLTLQTATDQTPVPTDGDVQIIYTDVTPAMWGAIEPLQGKELWTALQIRADVTHKITFRYNDKTKLLNAKSRVKYMGRIFELGPILNDDERNFMLTMMAVEKVS